MPNGQSSTPELLKKLEEGIEQVRNSERFREYLDTCARFHNYSLGNQILIAMQRPAATRVAGFHTWLGMERHVMKGQKGIAILAPMTYKRRTDEDEETTETAVTFRRVYVFDVSQTDGKPLPEIAPRLDGDDGNLYEKLAAVATAEGLTLDRDANHGHGSANGYYRGGQLIWIDPALSPAMSVKTFVHELAHHFSGHTGSCMESRNVAETIAESVAYVVLGHFGIDSSGYSFDYVAGWSQDAKTFKAELAQISKVAKLIIERIEKGEPSSVAAPSDSVPGVSETRRKCATGLGCLAGANSPFCNLHDVPGNSEKVSEGAGETYANKTREKCSHRTCKRWESPTDVDALCLEIVKARNAVAYERTRKPGKRATHKWGRFDIPGPTPPRNAAGGLTCKPSWSPVTYDREIDWIHALGMWTRAVNGWSQIERVKEAA
jgi:hypothetical protein